MSPEPDLVRAVVDRLTDGWAVLLVGDEEREHAIPIETLPEGAAEGSVLVVRPVDEEGLEVIGLDAAADAEGTRADLRARLARLRRTRSRGRFRR